MGGEKEVADRERGGSSSPGHDAWNAISVNKKPFLSAMSEAHPKSGSNV
jgi:hypothetical protein